MSHLPTFGVSNFLVEYIQRALGGHLLPVDLSVWEREMQTNAIKPVVHHVLSAAHQIPFR